MTISQVEIYKSPIKLKEPFVISLGPVEYAENVIVIIHTDSGITGFGECSPFLTILGETIDTCFIVGQHLARGLIGKNPLKIGDCSLIMDKIIYANSCIKSAFDIAIYDIASQHAGLPLYAFLGGKKNKELITDYTVSIGEPDKMAKDALKIKMDGFQVIKVKVGHSGKKDVERIRLIRQSIGHDIPLRIDANQGWETDEAIETLNTMAPFNIQFCEEPIARWNFMGLPEIRKQSPIPIMADESCCDHNDAKRLTDISACDCFNIKLAKSSGVFSALKILRIAEQKGIKIQIGGFLESRLGFTASAHLALTSENIAWCDFDTPLMFTEDPVEGGITYNSGGVVTVPDKPGLGATVSSKYLRSLTNIIIK
jgi:L-alanine-DL-glutamate epimerase-like enolase superfamily enzyme